MKRRKAKNNNDILYAIFVNPDNQANTLKTIQDIFQNYGLEAPTPTMIGIKIREAIGNSLPTKEIKLKMVKAIKLENVDPNLLNAIKKIDGVSISRQEGVVKINFEEISS